MGSFISSVVDGLDGFLDYLGSFSQRSIADYCDIETADNDTTLVSKDGSYLSVIEIRGVKHLIGDNTFVNSIVLPLKTVLQTNFETKAHKIQVFFEVDPDRTVSEIHNILAPARSTAKTLGLDMDDLMEERERVLSHWTAAEVCYLTLWTKPDALSKNDQKNEKVARQKLKLAQTASIENGQDPLCGFAALRDRHRSFTETMQSALGGVGVSTRLLDSHSAVRAMRKSVDYSFTAEGWSPSLPGDLVTPTLRKTIPLGEEWDIVWPKLGWQVCPRDATIVDNNVIEIGDRLYSPIFIDLFPKDLQFFSTLFLRIREKGIPWRISFLLEGDGLSDFSMKGMLSQIIGFAHENNRKIKGGFEGLKNFKEHSGGTILKIRATLSTWAPKGQKELVLSRAADLARSVEMWGGCGVSEVTGDPIAGFMSTALAMTQGSVGTAAAAPMEDALALLPLVRPSSPWDSGAVTFRSPDGKLMPYQPYSSKQTTWINLIFARPGSGKSVLMNMCNLALCLAPDLKNLPYIAIIDIGPSSSGLISLLKEALPVSQRHLVVHHRLQMIDKDAINPMDTQLGCRYPTPAELSFLRNFITLLATDMNSDKTYDGMSGLVSAVIDEVYNIRSDKNESIPYSRGVYEYIDDIVYKEGIHLDQKTTWWEIVDELFVRGFIHEAKVAQRQAVPLISDCTAAAQSEKIRNTYGTMRTPSGEPLIAAFCRLIGEALDFYPILARPTAFDLGDARVVALDLDDVAKSGGAIADRITAVMYMLARQVLAKDYYLNKDVVPEMPAPPSINLRDTVPAKEYRTYHLARIKEIRESPKRICYDEFHRTSKAEQVRNQVLLDMREGRKWLVDVMLSSQALEDFDPVMVEFATGIFVMDGGNAQTIENISKIFGFSDAAEKSALQYSVCGPKRGGGTFMAKFATTSGWYTMLLSATLGPIELWAFSTTAEDVAIRTALYDRLGPKRARKILAMRYPGGSAKDDIEDRKSKSKDDDSLLITGKALNITDQIIQELVQYAERQG